MRNISKVLNQGRIGESRTDSGIEFQKNLREVTNNIQARLLRNLPSNYPKTTNTNLALLYKGIAEEIARLQVSLSNINIDQYHEDTRTKYLYQVLGDLLFLGERSINERLTDAQYRDYLIKIRNAYLGGSGKDNLESSISDILGLPVELKEIYLELRKPDTVYRLKDTNKIFFDILMDSVSSSSNVGQLLEDINFFISLIRPAHVLYDTRLIWTDAFTNNDQICKKCEYEYLTNPIAEVIYDIEKAYVVTYALEKLYKLQSLVLGDGYGQIDTINANTEQIILQNGKILVYSDTTEYYEKDGSDINNAQLSDFSVGDYVQYEATKDAASNSSVIDTDWLYSGIVADIDESLNVITLEDNSKIVYNSDTLFYTRDGNGEYRTFLSTLEIGDELVFKAEKFTTEFTFYNTPEEVQDNYYAQFDRNVRSKPYFQENVKKKLKTIQGLSEGYHVIYEDGEAKVVKVDGKFYKFLNEKYYKEIAVTRFDLYIDDEFKQEIEYVEPEVVPSLAEIKTIFVDVYGYTEIEEPDTDWEIKRTNTEKYKETSIDGNLMTTYDDKVHLCDRKGSCYLTPFYEDTRKYFTWPDLQLVSGFFNTVDLIPLSSDSTQKNVPGYFKISADPNSYVVPQLPMFGLDGELAEASDLIVYLNGLKVDDAVSSVDPWTGEVFLNFLPPSNTKVRIDYYYAKRYPDAVQYTEEFKTKIVDDEENVGGEFSIIPEAGIVKRIYWPYEISNTDLYGDSRDYNVNLFPILNREGKLAGPEDITVSVGDIIATGSFEAQYIIVSNNTEIEEDDREKELPTTDINEKDYIELRSIGVDWSEVEIGDTIEITYPNYLDEKLIFSVDEKIDNSTLKILNTFPLTETSYDYKIIRYTEVEDAVEAVRPLLGHVRINFLPPSGSIVKFDYYYTQYERKYRFVPDFVDSFSRTTDSDWIYNGSGYLLDAFYGPRYGYSPIFDQGITGINEPVIDFNEIKKIGYRYRAFMLSESSVLNSPETLVLDGYEKYGKQASLKSDRNLLNQYGLSFSPEYLIDQDKNVILNDKYLEKDLPANTLLYEGTPLFIKTYTDDGHAKRFILPEGEDTYEDPDIYQHDLKGSFNIIDPDRSGLIDENSVCDYEENQKINLYSDLKVVETDNGGFDAHLTTISEGSRSLPISFTYVDIYYPNRELRINDYLDYINRIPSDIETGRAQVLKGSKTIKAIDKNWLTLHKGDLITFKDVPITDWDDDLKEYVTTYEDIVYTIVDVIDYETVQLHTSFKEKTGRYNYQIVRDTVIAVDVLLPGGNYVINNGVTGKVGNLNRELVFKESTGFGYGLPDSVLKNLPGYSGAGFSLNFPDPDPDPYPRSPDNPYITGLPAGSELLSSEIIKWDGSSVYANLGITGTDPYIVWYPGMGETYVYAGHTGANFLSGFTGPSGAIDLGLTGPTGSVDPRVLTDDDIYFVPSGSTGTYASFSESEYRVQWRDWDQDLILITFGGGTGPGGETAPSGVFVEDPINMTDDIGESIRRSYWNPNKYRAGDTGISHNYYFGSVVEMSDNESTTVNTTDHIDALIALSNNEARYIEDLYRNDPYTGINSAVSTLSLNDNTYPLRTRIIREILHDNTIKVSEIKEFGRTS
jgi:hypothetical protein